MRWRGDRVRFIAVVAVLLAVASCQGPCLRRRSTKGSTASGVSEPNEAQFAAQPLTHCRETRVRRPSGSVQLLVDASGSMVGVKDAIPGFATWIEHAVSSLKSVAIDVTGERTRQFNQAKGLFGRTPRIALADYAPQSATNLDDAIRAAADNELTFIITDGVAATGRGGRGDCASGVDAACVARALSEVVHPTSSSEIPGIWIVPLVTEYKGTFYSEEAIAPDDFVSEKTRQAVKLEFGVDDMDVFVANPKLAPDGRLSFTYHGPKALLLIVIARSAILGRDAVAALWDETSAQSVMRLGELKQFRTGSAALQPIEVYPGYLRRLHFKSLDRSDARTEHSGTLDVTWQPVSEESQSGTVRLDCPANAAGKGVYLLKGILDGMSEGQGCAPVLMLPAHTFRLLAVSSDDEGALRTVVPAFRHDDNNTLRMQLACGGAQRRTCDSPIRVRWEVVLDYRRTANGLADTAAESPALKLVRASSTEQPSLHPHRIFGLVPILTAFYGANTSDQQRLSLAHFNVCSGFGK